MGYFDWIFFMATKVLPGKIKVVMLCVAYELAMVNNCAKAVNQQWTK
jgi:hypothetical protein